MQGQESQAQDEGRPWGRQSYSFQSLSGKRRCAGRVPRNSRGWHVPRRILGASLAVHVVSVSVRGLLAFHVTPYIVPGNCRSSSRMRFLRLSQWSDTVLHMFNSRHMLAVTWLDYDRQHTMTESAAFCRFSSSTSMQVACASEAASSSAPGHIIKREETMTGETPLPRSPRSFVVFPCAGGAAEVEPGRQPVDSVLGSRWDNAHCIAPRGTPQLFVPDYSTLPACIFHLQDSIRVCVSRAPPVMVPQGLVALGGFTSSKSIKCSRRDEVPVTVSDMSRAIRC